MEIEIPFKSFKPKSFPVPVVTPVFSVDGQRIQIPCIIDSGADFCTIPISIGRGLGIDFTKIAPNEIRKKWADLDGGNLEQTAILIKEIIERRLVVPTTYGCACGQITEAYYYPATIEINDFKKEILILWTPRDISPLFGRTYLFDSIQEITFKKGEKTIIKT